MAPRLPAALAGVLLLLAAQPAVAWTETFAESGLDRRAIAAANGQIFLVGGVDAFGNVRGDVDVVEPATGTLAPFAKLPNAVADAAVAVADGRVYVFGAGVVQWFDPVTKESGTAGILSLPSTGPAAATHLGGRHFLLVGGATWDGTATHLAVVDASVDGGSAAPWTSNGTLPALATNLPPLVDTGSGIFLFDGGDVWRVDPASDVPAQLERSGGTWIESGSAVWNGTHVTVFDETGGVFAWSPAWNEGPALLDRFGGQQAVPPKAALLPMGTERAFLLALGGFAPRVDRWHLPEVAVVPVHDCAGGLTCVFDAATYSEPLSMSFRWSFEGIGVFEGPVVTVDFPKAFATYPLVIEARDALGRVALYEDPYFAVYLHAPSPYVEYECFGGNLTCRFDGSLSSDDGAIAGWEWTAETEAAACPSGSIVGGSAEAAEVWICIGAAADRNVSLVLVDDHGLRSWWNQTVNATGAPSMRAEAECHGLRCYIYADAWDDAGYPHIEVALPAGLPEGACPYVSGSYAECFFPANGTYTVTFTAYDGFLNGLPAGNATTRHVTVRVTNLPPDVWTYLRCLDGLRRCIAEGAAWDYDRPHHDIPVVWELDGAAAANDTFNVTFAADGIHRFRATATDALGWAVREERVEYVRGYQTRAIPSLPPGGGPSPVLAAEHDDVYVVDVALDPEVNRLLQFRDGAWVSVDRVPVAAARPFAAVHEGELWVAGGTTASGLSDAVSIRGRDGAWRAGPPLPQGLVNASLVAPWHGIYLLGGSCGDGCASAAAYVYDAESQAWVPLAALPWSGATFGAEVFGAVYAATSGGALSAYRAHNDSWEALPPPAGGFGEIRGLAGFDGYLWTLEASADGFVVRPYAPYESPEHQWNAPFATLGHAVAGGGDRIVALGGSTADGGRSAQELALPPAVEAKLFAAVRPLANVRESIVVSVRADVAVGLAFHEAVDVHVERAGNETAPTVWRGAVDLTPDRLADRVVVPPLPAGIYHVTLRAVATGQQYRIPVEVTTFW